MVIRLTLIPILLALMACASRPVSTTDLHAPLQRLAFLAGHCWQGTFPGTGQEDVHCYEPVFGGAHLRDRHAVTGGKEVYRGETIYSWDDRVEQIAYVYWNSLGGVSSGSARLDGTRIAFPDEQYSGPNGQTVTVATYWTDITTDHYDSLTVEHYADGTVRERRIRFVRRPFQADPASGR